MVDCADCAARVQPALRAADLLLYTSMYEYDAVRGVIMEESGGDPQTTIAVITAGRGLHRVAPPQTIHILHHKAILALYIANNKCYRCKRGR